MKIIFTGGHHNSSLIVAKSLLDRGHKIFWLGHRYSMENDRSLTAEYQEVTNATIPFYELKTAKFYQHLTPVNIFKIFFCFFQSLVLIIKLKPDLIVSFGGFLAVPVVAAGWTLRVRSITHEQTTEAGLANRFIAKIADKVMITWPSGAKFFPKNKTIVTGLPIKKDLLKTLPKQPNRKKTILILGGKQGSHKINCLIEEILAQLIKKYQIIHQTGNNSVTLDYPRLSNWRKSLSKDQQQQYLVFPYLFEKEMVKYLKLADLVVSRAGAHIVYELIACKKRAILIPIFWSSNNEQVKNAAKLKDLGLAYVFDENKVTAKLLAITIEKMLNNLKPWQAAGKKAKNLIIKDAQDKIVDYIEKNY